MSVEVREREVALGEVGAGAVGVHVLGELYECAPGALDDARKVREALLEAARRAGATIVADFVHRFSPHGLSGVVVIAESHLTIHTWPERGYAAVDLFTCGRTLRPEAGFAHLVEVLGSRRHTFTTLRRGTDARPVEPAAIEI